MRDDFGERVRERLRGAAAPATSNRTTAAAMAPFLMARRASVGYASLAIGGQPFVRDEIGATPSRVVASTVYPITPDVDLPHRCQKML